MISTIWNKKRELCAEIRCACSLKFRRRTRFYKILSNSIFDSTLSFCHVQGKHTIILTLTKYNRKIAEATIQSKSRQRVNILNMF